MREDSAKGGTNIMGRLRLNTSQCCIRLFAHKAPRECTRETESERMSRLAAMQRNVREFLERRDKGEASK